MMALHLASNNCYGVMLHNNHEYTEEQIRKELAKYGHVQELQLGGRNLIFAYFVEYEQARHCLDELQCDGNFNAKPARPRETRPYQRPGFQSRERSRSVTRKDFNKEDYKNRSKSCTREDPNGYPQKENVFEGRKRIPNNFTKQYSNEKPASKEVEDKPINMQVEEVTERLSETKIESDASQKPQGDRDQEDHSLDSDCSNEEETESSPTPYVKKRMWVDRSLPFPPLANGYDLYYAQRMRQRGYVLAYDIVVGNLPLWFNQGHLFRLVDKFVDPLKVILYESHNPLFVPYGIVYVGTYNEVETLIANMNGAVIDDNKVLIVKAVQDIVDGNW